MNKAEQQWKQYQFEFIKRNMIFCELLLLLHPHILLALFLALT
jgi:hypothetical protein